MSSSPNDPPSVLILTPMKNAASYLDTWAAGIAQLDWPRDRLSVGVLEGDSTDDTVASLGPTCGALASLGVATRIWHRDFDFQMPPDAPRWEHAYQLPRRRTLARARNHLLFRALGDQDWVLWLDVDVVQYPPDLIQRLLAAERDIVHPHCVTVPGGPTFDRNAWRRNGSQTMHDLRGGPDLVRLDSVGGTVLLVRADLHRDGLIFPPFPYGAANPAVRAPHPLGAAIKGELETEGLGLMAMDMGSQCWGMPNFEVIHA
jgi:peptide chain release factor subunit 1